MPSKCWKGSVPLIVLYILLAIAILLFMVMIHEFGHYISAKILKFKVNEFSIGFGKAIFQKTRKNGEIFSVRLVPLGGYCAFEGEDEDSPSPDAFTNQKPWKRLIVLFSGAFMNYLFAQFLIIVVFFSAGINFLSIYEGSEEQPGILPPAPGTVANPIQAGDVLISVDGHYLYLNNLAERTEKYKKGDEVNFEIYRPSTGEFLDLVLTKGDYIGTDEEGNPYIYTGFGFVQSSTAVRLPFGRTLGICFTYAFDMATFILNILWQLITFQTSILNLGGPITTIGVTAEVASTGFWNLMNLTSMIGLNLAVFNLLPFPALDGARMVFTTIEWIRGKPINRKVEGYIHAGGLVFLFGLVIILDLIKIFTGTIT